MTILSLCLSNEEFNKMKKYLAILMIAVSVIILNSCREEPAKPDDNDNNTEKVPPEDTVYATLEIWVDGLGDTVYSVALNKLPFSFARFSQVLEYTGGHPAGAAANFLMALKIYQQYKGEGIKALVSSISEESLLSSSGTESYNGLTLQTGDFSIIKSSLGNYPALTTAYVRGATPENSYAPQGPPYYYDFKFDNNNTDISKGMARIYVLTKGADSNRPITIIWDGDGKWRAKYWSSLLAGLK